MSDIQRWKEEDIFEKRILTRKNKLEKLKKEIKSKYPDIYEFIKLLQMDNRHNL